MSRFSVLETGQGASEGEKGNRMNVLSPVKQPRVFSGEQWMAPRQMTFVIKEKVTVVTNSDSGTVYDEAGNPQFDIKGKHLTIHDTIWIRTNQSQNIIGMKKRIISMRQTTDIVDKNNNVVAVMRKKSHLQLKSNVVVFYGDRDEGQPDLVIEGSYMARNFRVVDTKTGEVQSIIHRSQINARNILFRQDTYNITIAPHVDGPFILCICMSLDEMFNDSSGGGE